jgi:hypothetical protein
VWAAAAVPYFTSPAAAAVPYFTSSGKTKTVLVPYIPKSGVLKLF